MNLTEHAIMELEKAGYKIGPVDEIKTGDDYSNSIANSALELVKLFASQGHSGFSAQCTMHLFNTLANFGNLTPLTDNPDEWMDRSEMSNETIYQSKRNASCFSKDLKTYWDINADVNRVYEIEDGKETDYFSTKPESECQHWELVHVE